MSELRNYLRKWQGDKSVQGMCVCVVSLLRQSWYINQPMICQTVRWSYHQAFSLSLKIRKKVFDASKNPQSSSPQVPIPPWKLIPSGLGPTPVVLRAVQQLDHHLVDFFLLCDIHANQSWCNPFVDVLDGLTIARIAAPRGSCESKNGDREKKLHDVIIIMPIDTTILTCWHHKTEGTFRTPFPSNLFGSPSRSSRAWSINKGQGASPVPTNMYIYICLHV